MHHEVFRFVQPRRADEYLVDIATILEEPETGLLEPLAPLFGTPSPVSSGATALRELIAASPILTQGELEATALGRALSDAASEDGAPDGAPETLRRALSSLPDDISGDARRLAWTWTALAAARRLGTTPKSLGAKSGPSEAALIRAIRLARLHRLRATADVEFKRRDTFARIAGAAVGTPRAWRHVVAPLQRKVDVQKIEVTYDANFRATPPAVEAPKVRAAFRAQLLEDYRTLDRLIEKLATETRRMGLARQTEFNLTGGAGPAKRAGAEGDASPAGRIAAVEPSEVWASIGARLSEGEGDLTKRLSPARMSAPAQKRGGTVGAQPDLQVLESARSALSAQLNELLIDLELHAVNGAITEFVGYADQGTPAVKSLGFGDLIVARERLIGYEADEISAIINSAGNESLKRTHRHLSQSVTTSETETFERSSTLNELREANRFELQSQAAKTMQQEFGLQAGVKASGKYGVTQVDAFVAGQFSHSTSEAQSEATSFAKEVVNRSVTEIERSTRKLSRQTITEISEETNRHDFGVAQGQSKSNIYLHVDRVTECELRHYGTRLFLQFCIWEPAIGLTGSRALTANPAKPPEFDIASPAAIDETNYLAKAAKWGASVQPPPPRRRVVTTSWASTPTVDAEAGKNLPDVKALSVPIPDGYQPWCGKFTVNAIDRYRPAFFGLSIAGQDITDWQLAPPSYGHGADIWLAPWCGASEDHDVVGDLHIAIRIKDNGHHTATVTIQLVCERGLRVYREWQIATYQKLKDAYDRRVAELAQSAAETRMRGQPISGRSPLANARLVRNELVKWSIKALRQQPFNFDGLEDVVIGATASQEPSPAYAGHYSELAEFYMKGFEWEQGTYFHYPYFFGQRADYGRKLASESADPQFQEFLQAGMTMFLVPVTPGMEERVLNFLTSTEAEADKIAWTPIGTVPSEGQMSHLYELWQEVLIRKQRDLVMGSGTMSATTGDTHVVINADSAWTLEPIDVGREIFIEGDQYAIASITPGTTDQFELDRPFARTTNTEARYLTGSVRFGQPWQIRYPTSLVVLNDQKAELP